MKKEELFIPIREKYDELKKALRGTDIEKIRELTLEVHAMVHPAEISGRTEKAIVVGKNTRCILENLTWDQIQSIECSLFMC